MPEKINNETVSVILDGHFELVMDMLDSLILFSYLTEGPIENPLWKLHGEAQCLYIARQIGFRRLKDALTIKLIDNTEGLLIRAEKQIRPDANIIMFKNYIKS